MVVDTGVFIEHLRAKDKLSTTLYKISADNGLYTSAVTLYELYMGATTSDKIRDVEAITAYFTVLPFTDSVAQKAAQLYHELRLKNKMIEFRDIFIAATCLVHEMPIVTLNKKHFKRIENLEIL
ncbi:MULTISPECIES: type II toxin-antitoxin system VapC family toxin [Olivibacter]|jgi:predicted nucleic acid-binding protein|uniref:Ribonuclease VapC n=1 Tax=Olivibacter oleidegradans TaxID=760123 RepID=A0ABV6HNS8_9SPHI|nr:MULTISPECIES: type II toxin-antitoxin system VapC family toxin [Olivibacter]MDM8173196.1 type II toxin-antitoxin system VapC family toxin [Olivibacter sp. 47]QEL02988.1 type II toxin-antitoxin system VapC family toxin [Olivibacter sp. LS-1]